MRWLRVRAAVLTVSTVLALLSVNIERLGPDQVQYGNLCGATFDESCLEPVLGGGFPIVFLRDRPGVSVERQLHLVGDDFEIIAFGLDVLIYFFVTVLSLSVVERLIRRPG